MHYNENAGKPWIRQRFFCQCFKITILPKNFYRQSFVLYGIYHKEHYFRDGKALLTLFCTINKKMQKNTWHHINRRVNTVKHAFNCDNLYKISIFGYFA